MPTFAVLGATSWGVTLSALLAANGAHVLLLTRSDDEARAVAGRRGLARLPELVLPERVEPTADIARAATAEGLVVAVPAQAVAPSLAPLRVLRHLPVLSGAKGLEHGTRRRMSEVVAAAGWDTSLISVISGPNLAHEIARGLPAAAVVAAPAPVAAERWQHALAGPAFRIYSSGDVCGVELGGALKNIIAIAAGVSAGLDMGANATAAIMTRGLAEMTRLGGALGAQALTFQGLAGVGDLAATCYSPLSRNRRLGELLAAGLSEAHAEAQIGEAVEGAATAPVALELAHTAGVELPITAQVVALLDGKVDARGAMRELLSRSLKAEAAAGA
ncbi:MAG: NAD(P)H-dependent glycerol-3-phosphate dehydrogenase [Chloroflexi bacterium]|nr:NAD(P)H-dependent glycerol-3-phosphate dehydrogenase [Chloroflexota bacterium]